MKEAKSLIINSIYNVLYKMMNVLFPLITTTYVSKILLASGVGKIAYAQNISAYFVTVAALGIPNYGIRECAKVKDDSNLLNKLFSDLFTINFISTTICVVSYYLFILQFGVMLIDLKLYIIIGLSVVFNYMNVDWFYQGNEQYVYIAKRSFVIKIISLCLIFVFVRSPEHFYRYACIYILGIGGNSILNIINLKKFNIERFISLGGIKSHIKPILVLLSSVIAIELYTMVDTTMIGYFCNDENVGYYTNSMKLVKTLISVITAVGSVLLPRLSYYHSIGKVEECSEIVSKVFCIMLMFFVPCQIGLYMMSNQIVMILFGESFLPGESTLKIASFLICTLGFSNLFGTQILLTFGQEKKLLICTLFGAISNIFLNVILIPQFLQDGAAIASVVSESIVTILTLIFSLKFIKLHITEKFIRTLVSSNVALFCLLFIVKIFIKDNVLSLMVGVSCGLVLYLLINILAKNEFLFELYNKVWNFLNAKKCH